MTATDPAPALATGLLRERLGIEVLEASADLVVARMPVEGNRQPAGLLAGGASCVLAESTASQAAALHAGTLGRTAVGVEVNITHHRGVREGHVVARTTALHRGRTIATYEVVITDDRERRVSTARVTCVLRGLS